MAEEIGGQQGSDLGNLTDLKKFINDCVFKVLRCIGKKKLWKNYRRFRVMMTLCKAKYAHFKRNCIIKQFNIILMTVLR